MLSFGIDLRYPPALAPGPGCAELGDRLFGDDPLRLAGGPRGGGHVGVLGLGAVRPDLHPDPVPSSPSSSPVTSSSVVSTTISVTTHPRRGGDRLAGQRGQHVGLARHVPRTRTVPA